LRTGIYIRVSTEEQAREGYSIEAQKRKLLAYIESQDWTLADIYVDDGFSAKDLKRPAMQRLLKDVNNELLDIVLVYKLDRLTRSAADCDNLLKTFDTNKVMFQSATESFETRTATGRLFVRLIADLAQWERETIAERVKLGMDQKVREGKKPGGKYPYGYDKVGQQVQEEVEILKRIRQMYIDLEMSFKKIAVQLTIEGVMRRKYEWTQSTVGLTLENPFYAGIIRYGTKLPNGKYVQRKKDERVECIESIGEHEPVWTRQEYEQHIRLMRSRSTDSYSRKMEYWFTGLLKCGKCGSHMFGRLTTSRSLKNGEIVRHPYYWCSRRKENNTCSMPMFRQSHIEHLIINHIKSLVLDKELLKSEKQENQLIKKKDQQMNQLKRELEKIQTRIKKWQYMFVEGLISPEELRKNINQEKTKENQAQSELIELDNENQAPVKQKRALEMMELWAAANDKEKKEILNSIFKKITVCTDLENVKGVRNKFFDASVVPEYN